MATISQTRNEFRGDVSGQTDGRGGHAWRRRQSINVGDAERAVSVAGGAILGLLGLSRASLPGLLVAGVGGALVYRGVTGRCQMYKALNVDTARQVPEGWSQEKDVAEQGVRINQAFVINRPASALYSFWRNLENLPQIMTHLESVRVSDERRSHWVAKAHGLGGKRFEWDAEITQDVPNERIAWRSLQGADVENIGEVRFNPGLGDRGTEVHVSISYLPPAGKLGHWIAALLGQNPKRVVREDLRNFKRLMEIGEILTIIGQPHGTCKGQGERYTESNWKPLFT